MYIIQNNRILDDTVITDINFFEKNGILYRENGEKRIDDSTLVAITIMIAESGIEEKELMTRLVMNFLV